MITAAQAAAAAVADLAAAAASVASGEAVPLLFSFIIMV
jgi:hypothetical protein